MNRTLKLGLKDVPDIPVSLRRNSWQNQPVDEVDVDLGALFLHHYEDSYPDGPPPHDPSQFEYLKLVASSSDFRFHDYVAKASIIKKRSVSAEMGQAFCRLLLQEHFGGTYFAHMKDVLDKHPHPAFQGVTVARLGPGDVPDYLVANGNGQPYVAEAKGRFSKILFTTPAFSAWRDQFTRVQITGSDGRPKKFKGYIVATQFATESQNRDTRSLVEDPEIAGDDNLGDDLRGLIAGITALHFGSVFRKLRLTLLASALTDGFGLARDVLFQVPVWTCVAPPFEGREFVGGFYRTGAGAFPQLTENGWVTPLDLGAGQAVFVGLERSVAVGVANAAHGAWNELTGLQILTPNVASAYSSEVAWLPDGLIVAPITYLVPAGAQSL